MTKRPFSERELTMRVSELLDKKRFNAARKLLKLELVTARSLPKRKQRILLSNLVGVEVVAGRPGEALKVLRRKMVLGYSRTEEKFDDLLQMARLLAQREEWIAARKELIEIFESKGNLAWGGLLAALELYFNVEKDCYKLLNSKLKGIGKAAIRKWGIPITPDFEQGRIEEAVRRARATYQTAAKKYQGFLLRAYTDQSPGQRESLVADLREYVSSERVGFFKRQARDLLARLSTR